MEKKQTVQAAKVAPPADRFRTVLHDFFAGSQSAMARGLGCSQPMVSRVVAGEKEPGPRLLMALANFPGISRRWALTGQGEPLSSLGPEPMAGDAMLPIARQLVPGHLEAYREFLTDACLPVLRRDYRRSRYWLILDNDDQAERGLLRGDAILVESDGSWLGKPKLFKNKWCAIRPEPEAEPVLQLVSRYEPTLGVIIASTSPAARAEAPRYVTMGLSGFRRVPVKKPLAPPKDQAEKTAAGMPSTIAAERRPVTPSERKQDIRAVAAKGQDRPLDEAPFEAIVGVVVLLQRRWSWG